MKICKNGIVREMTTEEIEEYKAFAQDEPLPEPTAEERLEALEGAMLDLMGVTPNG